MAWAVCRDCPCALHCGTMRLTTHQTHTMRLLFLAALAPLAFQPQLHADRFHLASAQEESKAAEGSSPSIIEGVLLGEENGMYRLRVVGGEMWLAKSSVQRVEKDALTVADVEAREKAQAAAATTPAQNAVEATARRSDKAAADAVVAPAPVAAPAPVRVRFDPVLGTMVDPAELMADAMLERELAFAYTMTKDRRYIRLLRQLRRTR